MATLAAETSIDLGPYSTGATLKITRVGDQTSGQPTQLSAPKFDGVRRQNYLPMTITMSSGKVHTLQAGILELEYTVSS